MSWQPPAQQSEYNHSSFQHKPFGISTPELDCYEFVHWMEKLDGQSTIKTNAQILDALGWPSNLRRLRVVLTFLQEHDFISIEFTKSVPDHPSGRTINLLNAEFSV